MGVKIWNFRVKSRELSGNVRTIDTRLVYKSVALPFFMYVRQKKFQREIILSQVPCGTGIQTGNLVRFCNWHNKSRVRIILHTPAQKSFFYCLTLHLLPFLIAQIARYTG